METTLADQDDVNDVIQGAVITRIAMTADGIHIVLDDGRTIVIPDAQIVAVCMSRHFWN